LAETSKQLSNLNSDGAHRAIYNQEDHSITTSSFITAKAGHKISFVETSSTVQDISYYDGTVLLYTIRIIYSNSTRDAIVSVERTV
jgi:hypothetical protein